MACIERALQRQNGLGDGHPVPLARQQRRHEPEPDDQPLTIRRRGEGGRRGT
jgi:hypothetical protein